MKNLAVLALLAPFSLSALPAYAQKDVADPLQHFLASAAPERARRVLDDGVARLSGDFNNDGLADVALWQEVDLGPDTGPVWLYLRRKDGRYTAAGSIVVASRMLFTSMPIEHGSAKLLFCDWRGDQAVPAGYSLQGSIVADLPRAELPTSCAGADGAGAVCREACGEHAIPDVERLDIARYRMNRFEAWIAR
jgi:hypothetical protein